MVTKRIRSEYMKKFKDPKWETYTKCYEEMLKYRLTRRLLEHTHNPWFWSGSDSDSDSGGRSPPPPSKNQVRAENSREEEREDCAGARTDRRQQTRGTGPVPRLPLQEEQEEDDRAEQAAGHVSQSDGGGDTRVQQEDGEEQRARSRDEQGRAGSRPPSRKPPKSTTQARRSQQVRPAPSRHSREDTKESRHPFALYGSGEKDANISNKKTHNVGPAASTNEIHESALRAKTRREVERQIQVQRTARRRTKSVEVDKARTLVQPEFNPWLTEYMRCFSARSR